MRWRLSSPTAPRAAICARRSKPCPICSARCRASSSAAADRAISPRSATAFLPRRNLPRDFRARANGASLPRDLAQAVAGVCAAPIQRSPPNCSARSPTNCRPIAATAASCARAMRRRSTRRARCATNRAASSPRLQVRYAETTGIRSLKIQHNNVLGYFVDVTAQNGEKLMSAPLNATFIHRQTTAGQVRFTTTELGELEAKIANAAERALALELEIFDRLAAASRRRAPRSRMRPTRSPRSMSRRRWPISRSSATTCARKSTAASPSPSPAAAIRWSSRRSARRRARSSPTTAICRAGRRRIWLVTGPNMAGKSTFLRQNALIAVLAQMGSFVPARAAHIGVVDRLFSRVGAADDLARGRSTFMVEMVETAAILNQAGERALVILDEIGRGTATFDGLSIAWAAIEHLHEQQPLPRAVRHALSRDDGARRTNCRGCTTPPCGSRNGRARSCSCTKSCPAPPTAPTASRWRSSPACRRP